MTDVLIYWRDYRKNARRQSRPGTPTPKLLGELLPGDRLWFVTSGKNLRHEAEQAGFLVAVWQVQEVVAEPWRRSGLPAGRLPLPRHRQRGGIAAAR